MKSFLKVLKYDLLMTLRQREAMFWLLLFPLLVMTIFGLVFRDSGEIRLSVGLVDLDGFSILQAVVLVAFGVLAFGMRLRGNYPGMALMVVLGSLSFLAMGFLIASLARNSRSAGLAAQAVGLPMMFLSGIFFSLEWVPVPVRVIARSLPLYYLGDGLRGVMISAAPLADLWVDVAVLVGVGAAAFLAAVKLFRWE